MTRRCATLAITLALVTFARPTASAPGTRPRAAAGPERVDVREVLTRMIDEDRHPALNDPSWLALRSELDAEVTAHPDGPAAALARRAGARTELTATPLVATAPHTSTLALDARPWFALRTELPYFVEIRAALDGGTPVAIASAWDGTECDAKLGDIAWARPMRVGFHRVSLSADIAYLRRAPAAKRCTFRTRAQRSVKPMATPPAKEVVAREHRTLPALAFAVFDKPAADVVVRAAQTAPARMLDSHLPAIPFERWFASATGRPEIEWRSGFCNEDEALWWRPSDGDIEQMYWRAATPARRMRRELCATALANIAVKGRRVGVRIAVGTLLEDAGDWQFIPPKLYEAFIDGAANTIDIHALGELTNALASTEESWPSTDVSVSELTYTPAHPSPGQSVTVRATIVNRGAREVRNAHGSLTIVPCCDTPRRTVDDFVRTIPAGGTFVLARTVTLPEAAATMSACVWPFPPPGREDSAWRRRPKVDANPADNCAEASIGRARSDLR